MVAKWQKNEIAIIEYLKPFFENSKCYLIDEGGSNSNGADIEIFKIKDNSHFFNIESKCIGSQFAQFVVKPDLENNKFFVSEDVGNKFMRRELIVKHTKGIADYLNSNFEKYYGVGTKGKEINCEEIFKKKWIQEFLKLKKIRYLAAADKNEKIKIIHCNHFFSYFNYKLKIRNKKSGSSHISKKLLKKDNVKIYLENKYDCSISAINKKTVMKLSERNDIKKVDVYFEINGNNYFLSTDGCDIGSFNIKKRAKDNDSLTVIYELKLCSSNIKVDDLNQLKKDIS